MIRSVGFIGVGMMGHGMSVNILEKGFAMTVLDHRKRRPVGGQLERRRLEQTQGSRHGSRRKS